MRQRQTLAVIVAAAAALFAVSALTGCSTDHGAQIKLSGQLTYPPGTPLPDNANAQVSLVEHGKDGGEKRIVAERSLHDIDRQPVEFTIGVARNLIDPGGWYGLRAQIVDGDGRVRLQTPGAIRVKLLDRDKPLAIKLVPTGSQGRDLSFRKYRCDDGFHLAAAVTTDGAVVRLGNNRRLQLTHIVSRHPPRYSDDHDNKLRVSGDTIAFRIDGNKHSVCTRVAKSHSNDGHQGSNKPAQAQDSAHQGSNG